MSERTVDEVRQANLEDVLEHGPRLSYNRGTWVIARDPSTGEILSGGFGCMGIGEMWQTERPEHAHHPGYADAEIRSSRGGFGSRFNEDGSAKW